MVSPFEVRTQSKLEFAELLLNEITNSNHLGTGDYFEIAHEESCLFHIVGAKDAFLQEINDTYDLEIPTENIKEASVENAFKKKEINSKSFGKLKILMDDDTSWLREIILYRNIGTHRNRIPRLFNHVMNGPRKVYYQIPPSDTGKFMIQDIPQYLQSSINKMYNLIQDLRKLL